MAAGRRCTSRVPRDPAVEARIDQMLARMTLEQKVAQVVQPDIASITPEEYRRYRFGSVLAGGNSAPGRPRECAGAGMAGSGRRLLGRLDERSRRRAARFR